MKKAVFLIILPFFVLSMNAQNTLKSQFPTSNSKWLLADSFRIFTPDNLYDYIDGAADNYLSSGFENLIVGTYNARDDKEKYITVEIYDHKMPLLAFGIYAQERPLKTNFITVGAQGYQEEGILNFLCDRYYVKISSHDNSAATGKDIFQIANDLAKKLNNNSLLPKGLNYFPLEGKINNSENLISTNFLGYEFMNSALMATYGKDNQTFRIFIMEQADTKAAQNLVSKYMLAVKQNFDEKEGQYIINDPNNGIIKMEWKGKFVWGIVNNQKINITQDYLKLTRKQLEKYNAF
ncbi:MAG: hypothetical protein Q8928_04180 [Bacteroidota bacterium]|nr:hypothetical protein [Bacteroidota bacterium]